MNSNLSLIRDQCAVLNSDRSIDHRPHRKHSNTLPTAHVTEFKYTSLCKQNVCKYIGIIQANSS